MPNQLYIRDENQTKQHQENYKILVAAFPRGGSTFTAKAIAKYLDVQDNINEPDGSDLDFWRHITFSSPKGIIPISFEDYYKENNFKTTEEFEEYLKKPDVVIKVNYYTRILHLLTIPDDFKIFFVVRNPVEFACSNGRLFSLGNPHTYYLQRKNFMVENQENEIHFLMDTWIDIVNSIIDFSKTRHCLFLRYDTYVLNPEVLKSKLDKFLGTDNIMHDYKRSSLQEYPEDNYREDEINKLWEYIDSY